MQLCPQSQIYRREHHLHRPEDSAYQKKLPILAMVAAVAAGVDSQTRTLAAEIVFAYYPDC